jgi:hypothetical protein
MRPILRETYLAVSFSVGQIMKKDDIRNKKCISPPYILVSKNTLYDLLYREKKEIFPFLFSRFFSGIAWIVGGRLVAVTYPQAFFFAG